MKRRDFLKLGGAGLATSGLATAGLLGAAGPAAAAEVGISLAVTNCPVETVTGEKLNMLAYARTGSSNSGTGSSNAAPRVPGPVLRVTEGDIVTISIFNDRPEPHNLEIGGIGASPLVAPGQTGTLTFTAPAAGTYLYHDSSHASGHLYRVLGLHGALVVHPSNGMSRVDTAKRCITPYSMDRYNASNPADPAYKAYQAMRNVSLLFEALGTIPRFAGVPGGGKWVPCGLDQDFSPQEKIWLFNQIDPKFNALITSSGITYSDATASAAAMVANFVPRYFTINGRSGFDLADKEDVVVKNYIGEPTLLRTLNAGLTHHATHIHGNHVLELAHSVLTNDGIVPVMGGAAGAPGEVVLHDNIWERDVWPTWPMQIRDMLLPLEIPPDIPNWDKHAAGRADEAFPLRYVMHDHCEMGTTAAGGNYPQGAVTHWEILGRAGGRGPV
jgi:hypothetical protein